MDWMHTYWVYGCFGALVPDILRVIRERYQPKILYLRYAPFWIGLALLVGLGGLLAYWCKADTIQAALAYGFSGPEIVTRLLATLTRPPSAIGGAAGGGAVPAPRLNIREWWAR
jgi:hypothetical protein